MPRLIVRPEAERDLLEAASWYEDERPGLGEQFLAEVDTLLSRVAEHPSQFPEIRDGVRRGIHRRFPYCVYFVAEPEVVVVLAVLHMHRHPDKWRGRQ